MDYEQYIERDQSKVGRITFSRFSCSIIWLVLKWFLPYARAYICIYHWQVTIKAGYEKIIIKISMSL